MNTTISIIIILFAIICGCLVYLILTINYIEKKLIESKSILENIYYDILSINDINKKILSHTGDVLELNKHTIEDNNKLIDMLKKTIKQNK